MANHSSPPAPPQMSAPEDGLEGACLEGYREAVLCYARLCTTGLAEAEQLADEAFSLAAEWRHQGEHLPWLPLLLMAVLETADRWLTQGQGAWLSTELSGWLCERSARQSRAPEQQPLALQALQRMAPADAELLWAALVEGLNIRGDAGAGTWAPNREREVARVKAAFRQRCLWARAVEVVESDGRCRGYVGLLEAVTRSPHERSPDDLQQHLAGCARCAETAVCLRVSDDLPGVLVTAVLGWGGEAYLERRKIAARRHQGGPASMERRHRATGWQVSLRGRPVWASAAVLLAAIGMVSVLSSMPWESTPGSDQGATGEAVSAVAPQTPPIRRATASATHAAPMPVTSGVSPSLSAGSTEKPGAYCTAIYTLVKQWPGGFQAEVRITPRSTMTDWTVRWTYTDGQRVTQMWNGEFAQDGDTVLITPADYDGTIAAGDTLSLGYLGTSSTYNSAPEYITVDGHPCQS
ncbi:MULTISPECIES: cellulose-binding domain-containing protein [unclassified Streptomyces]|uniref:cellulose-binding domain-containing protein n=1 Tax=unclassified Streptomyces TaxID=2593676 RepID=UPI002258CB16|nr:MULTISPECIES: cellulose-binding domain-containing protein [unclassified Streptomyces]MCX5287057.1 cellulose-binding domain-containing protein [Streptomyces sp. NBC_00183]